MKPSIKRAIKLLKANAVFVAVNVDIMALSIPENIASERLTVILLTRKDG